MNAKPRTLICSVIVIILCISVFSIRAEEKRDISAILNKLKKHYEERIDAFKKENRALKNVIFLGDSLTEGFDLDTYFPERRCLNRGIVADHIGVQDKPGILQRLNVSVFDCNPSTVFLLIGVNDLADKDHIFDELVRGYREIIKKIQEHDSRIKIMVQTCLPARGKYEHLNPLIVRFNDEIKTIAKDMNCPFLDLHPLFTDEKGQLREELTRDGIHLTSEGYAIWADRISTAFQSLDPDEPPAISNVND